MPKPSFFLLLLLVLLLCHPSFSSGQVGRSINDGVAQSSDLLNKIHDARKFLVEISMDYNDGRANNKNDPKNGKPGIGTKSP
ncbi:hypothetical protein J5N97_004503 [Dioscorea zingiberensis]|uniref:Uncharacterized protein n=1 Tax=Dioscorea zingiberensis TaxID=325984 RepID=A0A9D5HS65_9LILI|nr:hypothetical protein J5N97_004503 [Dioscorea zingiberensis]